jgi:transcriptional regulator with XRE-family HTH domain
MKNLKALRVKAGLSQGELASKINVTQGTISNWENGKGAPDASQVTQLRTILGPPEDDDSMQPSPLAIWLTKGRVEKNWSVPELAHHSGLTPAAIYRIESGVTRNLRKKTRQNLEKALGTKVSQEAIQELEQESSVEGMGSLEDFDPYDDSERPAEPGIYMLYDISQRPIYVGEGSNVKIRIRDHEDKFWFKKPIVESASWIKVSDKTLRKRIESLLIKFLKSNAVINKQNVEGRE